MRNKANFRDFERKTRVQLKSKANLGSMGGNTVSHVRSGPRDVLEYLGLGLEVEDLLGVSVHDGIDQLLGIGEAEPVSVGWLSEDSVGKVSIHALRAGTYKQNK